MRLRGLREDELPAVLERQRADYRTQLVEWAGLSPELAERKTAEDTASLAEGVELRALEAEARTRGLPVDEFNVWGGNAVARSLYRTLGYEERSVFMGKNL